VANDGGGGGYIENQVSGPIYTLGRSAPLPRFSYPGLRFEDLTPPYTPKPTKLALYSHTLKGCERIVPPTFETAFVLVLPLCHI
jgi:hypothetical protein